MYNQALRWHLPTTGPSKERLTATNRTSTLSQSALCSIHDHYHGVNMFGCSLPQVSKYNKMTYLLKIPSLNGNARQFSLVTQL